MLKGLPFLKCKGKCQAACACAPCLPVDIALLGPRPEEPYDDSLITCAWLDADGRCVTYNTRPPICQLFGAVRDMRCPYGCRPRVWPSASQERRWMKQAKGETTSLEDGVLFLIAEGPVSADKMKAVLEVEVEAAP